MKINVTRVILGGLAAAVILFISSGVLNGAILNDDFQNWLQTVGTVLSPPSFPVAMTLWTVMSLIFGVSGVWLYAAIRPTFGAGPKTALVAAFALWIISKLPAALDLIALGVFPMRIISGQLLGSLISMVVAIVVGAWIYKV